MLEKKYRELWNSDDIPDVFRFLGDQDRAPLHELLEVIKEDQRRRWAMGRPTEVEEYFRRLPHLFGNPLATAALIANEFQARFDATGEVDVDRYLAQYSELADELRVAPLATPSGSMDDSCDTIDERKGDEQEGPSDASRIDRLCDQFESAWKQLGRSPEMQPYLASCPPELLGNALSELIRLDLWWRRKTGETTTVEQPGPILGSGRYQLQRLLGSGSFGDVYLAHDVKLEREVAVKIAKYSERDRSGWDSYSTEAKLLAKLDHPNIVPAFDVGQADDGRVFIVSKYIAGTDLQAKLAERRPTFSDTAQLVAKIADAVHHAHTQGLVHRDLKPANILIDESGIPYVTDFGLAIHEDWQGERAGEFAGTTLYMAPEQIRGEVHHIDGRADVWAMGVILYQMCTGRWPFNGATRRELAGEILQREAKPPRQINDRVPAELERITLKCLSKNSVDRYCTGKDLAEDLRKMPFVEPSGGDRGDRLLCGRYRLLEESGSGNLGSYYSARDVRFDMKVTIWLGNQSIRDHSDRRDHFLQSAQQAAKFRHPHAINHLNYDVLDDGHPVLVMEDLCGKTLEELIEGEHPGRPVRIDFLLALVRQIAPALDAAHQQGLLHGSLKAANVLCDDSQRSEPKFVLLHLGIPALGSMGRPQARTMSIPLADISGSPIDMAPEQVDAGTIDRRTDIYHFGALLYRLLTGHRPFESSAEKALTLLRAIGFDAPPSLRTWPGCEGLSDKLDELVLGCLAKNPQERPQSIAIVAQQFLELLEKAVPELVAANRPHEDVQFTVYRPKSMAAECWSTMLAFAHRSEIQKDDPKQIDPIKEMQHQAEQVLGASLDTYVSTSQDTQQAIPDESLLTFVPQVEGVRFNPSSRSFYFSETVHREEFRMWANGRLKGTSTRGRLNVFLGNLLIAEVPLIFRIVEAIEEPNAPADRTTQYDCEQGRRFTRIYASCSPRDARVVGELQAYMRTLGVGCRILSAATHLRNDAGLDDAGLDDAGLDDELQELIRSSDVFQLFWSSNSMHSSFVRNEWEYALSLQRKEFVRPVYWEVPIPADPTRGLPPEELRRLSFTRIQPQAEHDSTSESRRVSSADNHIDLSPTFGCTPQMTQEQPPVKQAANKSQWKSAQRRSRGMPWVAILVALAMLAALAYFVS